MCVIIAKYFDDHGWVAVKNRDRNYTPEISFKQKRSDGNEILYFWDDITQYCEGLNGAGIGVLSASLMVLDDEKEISVRTKTPSKDGKKIKKALTYGNVQEVVRSLIENELTGNTVIFDREHMYLLEGTWIEGQYEKRGGYEHRVKEIPKNQTVARTNHGIWIPWAGYQRCEEKNETLSRISSEARLAQAEYVVNMASTPEEMMDGLCQIWIDDPQLNAMRTSTEVKKMRTTAQLMIIAEENTLYCRPISSHITFDFWQFNDPDVNTWVEIISNRALYQKQKQGEPPFKDVHAKHTIEEATNHLARIIELSKIK